MSDHDAAEQPTARWTRDRLDAYATERGIDPAQHATKDDLVAAIAAAGDEPADGEAADAADADAADDGDGDAETDPDEGEDEPETVAATRYRVLKAITLADGRTVMPGEEFVPDAGFPARRPKQLVEQKFLRPID